MEIWDKLDEVILGVAGTGILGILGYTAITNGYNGGTAQICVTGIVAVLTGAMALKSKKENGK